MKTIRPILRYFGGKWKLAPWIISHFPEHRIYVEPFGGGGSVLLRKRRSYSEVYNDLDSEITNLFAVVRDRGEELRDKLYFTPYSRTEFELSYQKSEDPLEQARRTVVRSFMGFAGSGMNQITGFRSNANRNGTTPAHDWMNYPAAMAGIIERLRGVTIENRDALECMAQHDGPETLHYVDPPYVHSTRTKYRYKCEMTDRDHDELADSLKQLQGPVIVSGYDSELYRALFADFELVQIRAFADGALERTECLWLNPKAAAAWRRRDLFREATV